MEWLHGQKDVYNAILNSIVTSRPVALEAYPGVGKTRASILACVHSASRCLFVVRTHTEQDVYIVEGLRVGVKVYPLLARYGFCPLFQKTLLPTTFYQFCKSLRERGKCVYFNKTIWSLRDRSLFKEWHDLDFDSINSFVDIVKQKGLCPFTASFVFSRIADLVVATYPYILDDEIFDVVGEDLVYNKVVIFDEVQTVFNWYISLFRSIHISDLRSFAREIAKNTSSEERQRLISALENLSRLALSYEKRRRYRVTLDQVMDMATDILTELLEGFTAKSYRRSIVLVPRLERLKNKLGLARVMMSAYVPRTLVKLMNLDLVTVEPPEPLVKLTIVDDVTTRYDEFEENIDRIAHHLKELLSVSAKPIAIFFPSKRVGMEIMKKLKELGLDLTDKVVWNGRETSTEIDVLIDVAGGRYAEGVNIPVRTVVVVGLPYPEPNPATDAIAKVLGWDAIEDIMMTRLLQAIGRATRLRGHVYLLDYRARDLNLPSWVGLQ